MADLLQKFLYRTILLNVFMQSTVIYDQQPPKSFHLNAIRLELLKFVSENINAMVPIDFCLNETTLEALESNKFLPSLLAGHEDDPLDEKQSNFLFISNIV